MKDLLIKINTLFKPLYGANRYVAGIGRSTVGLLQALEKKDNLPFKIHLYGTAVRSIGYDTSQIKFPTTRLIIPQSFATKSGFESWYVNNRNSNSILHIPHNTDEIMRKSDFLVSIHDTCEYDLIAKKNNDQATIDLWQYSAKKSLGIVTCSECSKEDIIDRFHVAPDKITVIPWGIDTATFKILDKGIVTSKLQELGICAPYFFSVSCSNIRKNMQNLLKAFRLFSETNNAVSLVLIWSNPSPDILEEYKKEIGEGRIIFLDHVTDEDLVVLYNGALGTMYPSRYEGFGFPILESFACGTPVMTCKNSSLAEIGADVAMFVGEDDIDEMASIMKELSSSAYNYEDFRVKSSRHLDKYSWSKTADEYIRFYSNFLY